MEKAEDIQFHPWNTSYIFMAVKYSFLYFHGCENTAFLRYALYLINIFLYFITLYIINRFLILISKCTSECTVYAYNKLFQGLRPDLGLNIDPFPIQKWAKTQELFYGTTTKLGSDTESYVSIKHMKFGVYTYSS